MAFKKKKNDNLERGKIDWETLMLWGRDWIIQVLQCIHYVEQTIGSKNTANFRCTSTGFKAPCFSGRNLSWRGVQETVTRPVPQSSLNEGMRRRSCGECSVKRLQGSGETLQYQSV